MGKTIIQVVDAITDADAIQPGFGVNKGVLFKKRPFGLFLFK
jgi:hypothetical protein